MRKLHIILIFQFVLLLHHFCSGAMLQEIIVNKEAELKFCCINFKAYQITLNAYGFISSIDVLYDSLTIEDYQFSFGKMTFQGDEEFISNNPHKVHPTYVALEINKSHNIFINTKEQAFNPVVDYKNIKYREPYELEFYAVKHSIKKIENLSFTYENGDGSGRILSIGDVRFEYTANTKSKHLERIGNYKITSYRDLKISKKYNDDLSQTFRIRVINIY